MRRAATADWCAGVLAIIVFAVGGLVVVKPAVDHWNDLYRGDPYRGETTTQTVRTRAAGHPAVRTTVTKRESASSAERVLGKGGLLFLRLSIVVLTAFLAAAVLHRVVLGSYGLRGRPAGGQAAAVAAPPELSGVSRKPAEPQSGEQPAPGENGRSGEARAPAPESNGAELASSIGKFVAWRREELGLSQRELAKRAGISHTVISRLESGQQVPSPKTLERLADAFRV
jgi:DNA-binding XRE family transcriptional regulator